MLIFVRNLHHINHCFIFAQVFEHYLHICIQKFSSKDFSKQLYHTFFVVKYQSNGKKDMTAKIFFNLILIIFCTLSTTNAIASEPTRTSFPETTADSTATKCAPFFNGTHKICSCALNGTKCKFPDRCGKPDSIYKFYLKTNAPAWLMLWTNIGVEFDLDRHISAQIPVYYSGFNYFSSKTKFRTLAFMPEMRFWLKSDNMGFFANAHIGIAWYNYAKNSEYRWQDHNRNSPAYGGGLGIGYRFHFVKNHRWTMEAGIGAGIYYLDYDIFQNRHNGLRVGREHKMFYGIDQAFVSFCYSFDIVMKGGCK